MFTQLLDQHFVHTALWAGAVAAVVTGTIGVFVVTRGMSFAVHALSELGFTGAAGALVIGIDPVLGILGGSLFVGLVLGLLSLRGRERDSAIGAVLAFGLGLGYLFFSLYQAYANQALNLLFGNILGVSDTQLRNLAIVGAVVLLGLALLYRPLFFSSVDPEIAAARGVPLRALSVAIFLLLALTTAEAIQVVGVLLVLALVITPAAAAQRLTGRPTLALLLSVAIALVSTEGGILLSLAKPWPPSFFITTISFGAYVAARFYDWSRGRSSFSRRRLWSIRRVRWSDVRVAASLPAATVILYSTGRSCNGVLKLPVASRIGCATTRHRPLTRRHTATAASGRGETSPASTRGLSARTCTRGVTETGTDVPFVPGATRRNAVLARGWKVSRAGLLTRRRAIHAPVGVRCCSTASCTFAARAASVMRLPYSTWLLLTESWSCPIENQVDSRCSDRATPAALRRTTAPDARRKTTDCARRLLSRCTCADSIALPRPSCPASRVDEKLYGPQLWCGE